MSFENLQSLPADSEKEKVVLGSMLIKGGACIPDVSAILNPSDFFIPKHRTIYQAILKIYAEELPVHTLSLSTELRKSGELDKIGLNFILTLPEVTPTDAYAVAFANDIKALAKRRKLIVDTNAIVAQLQEGKVSVEDIAANATSIFSDVAADTVSSNITDFSSYFKSQFFPAIEDLRIYADRTTGFDNLDERQFFAPGLYVIGATPAAGKTTFCWQLLEQLALNGENCIFCSYEMSALELYSKSVARDIFRQSPSTKLTSAAIRRGAYSNAMYDTIEAFIVSDLSLKVIELQNETVDALLNLLTPLCKKADKAPIVCIDYLQIMPTDKDNLKIGIDDTVRKLKKFQRDTNTTFIVVSSFNRTNYLSQVSFESFKESGGIEYTADVVWALQLNVLNSVKGMTDVSQIRKKIDDAKKQQPRQIQLKCLKNRAGSNYDCYFNYYAAHDCFEPCDKFDDEEVEGPPETSLHTKNHEE